MTPRFEGAVIGYRAWQMLPRVDVVSTMRAISASLYLQLGPMNVGDAWPAGEACTARCEVQNTARGLIAGSLNRHKLSHAAKHTPNARCSCGLHAYYNSNSGGRVFWEQGTAAWGALVAWGRIVLHADGFRAEHALPVALLRHPQMTLQTADLAEEYCARHGLAWCRNVTELEAEAHRYADPVPASDRPEPDFQIQLKAFSNHIAVATGGLSALMGSIALPPPPPPPPTARF